MQFLPLAVSNIQLSVERFHIVKDNLRLLRGNWREPAIMINLVKCKLCISKILSPTFYTPSPPPTSSLQISVFTPPNLFKIAH